MVSTIITDSKLFHQVKRTVLHLFHPFYFFPFAFLFKVLFPCNLQKVKKQVTKYFTSTSWVSLEDRKQTTDFNLSTIPTFLVTFLGLQLSTTLPHLAQFSALLATMHTNLVMTKTLFF